MFESTRGSTTSGGRRFWTDRGMRQHSETSNLSKPEGLPHTKRTGFCLSLCVRTSTRGFEPPTYRLGGGRSILLSYVDKTVVLQYPQHHVMITYITISYKLNFISTKLYFWISLSSNGSPHWGQNFGGCIGSSGSQPHLSHL